MKGMVKITGGTFLMGSNDHYPEEAPAHAAMVGDFWIDETPVTNRMFREFVSQTGYVTQAERAPDPAMYPGMDPALAVPASAVFTPPAEPGPVAPLSWWTLVPGADWEHPLGPTSNADSLLDHPVVHIGFEDALSYAAWAGKALPSEAQWEFAARGGLAGKAFAWGDEFEPEGRCLANYWQGPFPRLNRMTDGFYRTSPVRSFPQNGFGLYDMIGNVWEWTTDLFRDHHRIPASGKSCCGPASRPQQAQPALTNFATGAAVFTLKGGSYLCAENYCRRYRPAARHPQPADTTTSHVGFRCVKLAG